MLGVAILSSEVLRKGVVNNFDELAEHQSQLVFLWIEKRPNSVYVPPTTAEVNW